jgi:hypothetical protein
LGDHPEVRADAAGKRTIGLRRCQLHRNSRGLSSARHHLDEAAFSLSALAANGRRPREKRRVPTIDA